MDLVEAYVANGLGIGRGGGNSKKDAAGQCPRPAVARFSTRRGGSDVARAADSVAAGIFGGNEIERATADVSGAMTGESGHGLNRTTYQGCGPSPTLMVALVVAKSSASCAASQVSSVVWFC